MKVRFLNSAVYQARCFSLQADCRGQKICESNCYSFLGTTFGFVVYSLRIIRVHYFQFEKFHIDDTLRLNSSLFTSKMDVPSPPASSLELPAVPFDVGLKLRNSEREAKKNVTLPYTVVQQQQGLYYVFKVCIHACVQE